MRQEQPQEYHHAISTVAKRLDMHPATLLLWVNQAEIDKGARAGTTTADAARIAEPEWLTGMNGMLMARRARRYARHARNEAGISSRRRA
jgi:transposase-like protein